MSNLDPTRGQNPTTKEEDVLAECRKRRSEAIEMWSDIHEHARLCTRFRNNDQYPDEIKEHMQHRPQMVFNQMETYISQVTGAARQNRYSIQCLPADSNFFFDDEPQKFPSMTGDHDYQLAQVYESLIRQIEYVSNADNAYDTAIDHAAGSTFGFFQIGTVYADDSGFDKEIRIMRIENPMSVMIDLANAGMVGEGSMWGFVDHWFKHDELKRMFGKDVASGEQLEVLGEHKTHWWTHDKMLVTEYYRKIPTKRRYALLESGESINMGDDKAKWPGDRRMIESHGGVIREIRDVENCKVEWCVTNGSKRLDGPVEFPSKYIPLILVPGREVNEDGQRHLKSLISNSMDAQRYYNYKRNAIAERYALGTKAQWHGPAKAFEGFSAIWRDANVKNYAYLPWNDKASMAPQRVDPPAMPMGDVRDLADAENDIKLTMGIFNAGLGQPGNETSGYAINLKKTTSDVGTFVFHDNLAKAITHGAKIIVDMIPKIYDNQRVLRIRTPENESDAVMINYQDPMTGRKLYDMGVGKFDVYCKAGGNYTTQREEFIDTVSTIMQGNPQALDVIGDVFFSNMDNPGADALAKRYRAMLPDAIKKAEKQGDNEENQEITPAMVQEMIAQTLQSAGIDIKQREVAVKEHKAETDRMKALGDISGDISDDQATQNDALRGMIAEVLAEFLQQAQEFRQNDAPSDVPSDAPMQ